jgi:NADPH:quinone reductase-like Zn-dependent oxidoreductase
MKAVMLTGHGGFDRLEFRDVPVPTPAHGEVLIRVGAAAINNTDINTRTGWYSRAVSEGTTATGAAQGLAAARAEDSGWTGDAPRFPRIQGADACGHIVAVGIGVDSARIGERVLVEPVFRRAGAGAADARGTHATDPCRAIYFGSEVDGAFAQFARLPAAHAHAVSSTLSDIELASFPCSYSAAENMLTRLQVEAGEKVLITGASGGVGSAAVQLAKRRGAWVCAVVGAHKSAAVSALGADHVIARDAALTSSLGIESMDAVVDIVGGAQFPSLLDVLRRGGRYAAAGAIAGPLVELDLRTLYLKDLRLFGCTVLEPQVFGNLVAYIERAEIKPVIASVHPLQAIVAAQQEFLTKRHTGKIVLVPPL